MLTKVAENIYQKVVPLPNNPLREIGPRDKEFYFRDHRVQEGLL